MSATVVSIDRRTSRSAEGPALLLRRAHRALRRAIGARLERLGVSMNQFTVLHALWSCDGLSQAELSEESEVDKATLTASINGLAAAGLVERRDHATDRRKNNIFLTPAGRALEVPVMHEADETIALALAGIAQSDVTVMRSVLTAMLANLGQLDARVTRRR